MESAFTLNKIELKKNTYNRVKGMDNNNVIIFINKDALKIEEIFLDEEWTLTKFFDNVYSISVHNRKLDWLVKSYDKIKYAKKESENLNKLKKIKGVPKMLAVGLSKNFSYIILSQAPGMDLFEYTEKYGYFSEKTIKPIVRQILNIINKIHHLDIIHKDIKPENIIYDRTTQDIVLIDFEGKCTDDYRSPEQVLGTSISAKTDIWSIGATIYYLVHGEVPFKCSKDILNKHFNCSKKISQEFRDFLNRLMEKEVSLRYNIQDALNHPWIYE